MIINVLSLLIFIIFSFRVIIEDLKNTIVDHTDFINSLVGFVFLYIIFFVEKYEIILFFIWLIISSIILFCSKKVKKDSYEEEVFREVSSLVISVFLIFLSLFSFYPFLFISLSILFFLLELSEKISEKVYYVLGTGINDVEMLFFSIPIILFVLSRSVNLFFIFIFFLLVLSSLITYVYSKKIDIKRSILFFILSEIILSALYLLFFFLGNYFLSFTFLILSLLLMFLRAKKFSSFEKVEYKYGKDIKEDDLIAYDIRNKNGDSLFLEGLYNVEKVREKYANEKLKLIYKLSIPFFPIFLSSLVFIVIIYFYSTL